MKTTVAGTFSRWGCQALGAAALLTLVGAAVAEPIAHLSRTAVSFGRVPKGVPSPVQPVFVTNTGNASLTIQALTLGGPNPGDFTVGGTCAPPTTLAPEGRCRVDLVQTSATSLPSDRSATLSIASNAPSPAPVVNLQGVVDVGTLYPYPVDATPDYLDFPGQAIGTQAAPQTIVITNPDPLTFTVTRFDLAGGDAGDFAMTSDCPVGTVLGRNKSCTATIGFSPTASGPRSTQLHVTLSYLSIDGFFAYSLTGVGAAGGAPQPVPVFEYYNAQLDHYFITWLPGEIAILDAGVQIKGWARTGRQFRAHSTAQAGTTPVCRYCIPPGKGDSHFFGRGTVECNDTGLKNPTFTLEDPAFMHMVLPGQASVPMARRTSTASSATGRTRITGT